ncbi:MAG: hypothetical protein AAF570_12695 [Bacteroidota bacterium]
MERSNANNARLHKAIALREKTWDCGDLPEEAIASIQRGIKDFEEGRVLTYQEVADRRKAKHGI